MSFSVTEQEEAHILGVFYANSLPWTDWLVQADSRGPTWLDRFSQDLASNRQGEPGRKYHQITSMILCAHLLVWTKYFQSVFTQFEFLLMETWPIFTC